MLCVFLLSAKTKEKSPRIFLPFLDKNVAKLCKYVKKQLDIRTLIKYNFPIHYKNITKRIKNEKNKKETRKKKQT